MFAFNIAKLNQENCSPSRRTHSRRRTQRSCNILKVTGIDLAHAPPTRSHARTKQNYFPVERWHSHPLASDRRLHNALWFGLKILALVFVCSPVCPKVVWKKYSLASRHRELGTSTWFRLRCECQIQNIYQKSSQGPRVLGS